MLQVENEGDEDDDWEYVEEGPAEIIWQGNEIIIRKKKVRVPKRDANHLSGKEVSVHLSPTRFTYFLDYSVACFLFSYAMLLIFHLICRMLIGLHLILFPHNLKFLLTTRMHNRH